MIAPFACAVPGGDERREWALHVIGLMHRLPDTQRAVVSLAYFRGRSQAQIARELGLSQRAVGRAMALALAAIGGAQLA